MSNIVESFQSKQIVITHFIKITQTHIHTHTYTYTHTHIYIFKIIKKIDSPELVNNLL